MKSSGEKSIEVANVSYLTYCKLDSVDPDVKKGWSMDPVQMVVHGLGVSAMYTTLFMNDIDLFSTDYQQG